VADTIDELVAAIANSRVADISPGVAEEVGQCRENGIRGGSCEGVAGMVAVLVANVAVHAQIVVLAGEAGHKLLLREALDTAVASACRLIVRRN
jgi:hypothetical protein